MGAGFIGRDAWRGSDLSAFGLMSALYSGASDWLDPSLLGFKPEFPALLPYWLGAGFMHLIPVTWSAEVWVRVPFALLLALAMAGTWHGTYYLARTSAAQPVAFAFGGEAHPVDYARALADGALLAFMASLGLAQLGHETTPALAQLGFTALMFYGLSAIHHRLFFPGLCVALGQIGLALSGAPTLALLFGLGGAAIHGLDTGSKPNSSARRYTIEGAGVAVFSLLLIPVIRALDLWQWKIEWPSQDWNYWNGHIQLFLWFTWPAWPLALYSAWRWRHRLFSLELNRHLSLPGWFASVTVVAMLFSASPDKTLLIALPALAAIASFALPTLRREVSALIDWFTLLFFTGCGLVIWVVWIAMQTGVPPQPAANVARLAPGFTASFQTAPFLIACIATLAWCYLVRWRVGRHRTAIWKSLVLPAGGASLCWVLLMSLWMPLLNFSQGAQAMVTQTQKVIPSGDCATVMNLDLSQIAALKWYGGIELRRAGLSPTCGWMITEPNDRGDVSPTVDREIWIDHTLVKHPVAATEMFWILKRR
jgi:hypothetical protein